MMKPGGLTIVLGGGPKPKGKGLPAMGDEPDTEEGSDEETGSEREKALKGAYRALKSGDQDGFVEWMTTAMEC